MLKRTFAVVGVIALLAGGIVASASNASVRVPTKVTTVRKFVGHVFFASGSYALGSDDKALLQKVSKSQAKAYALEIIGFVQLAGSHSNDISLSSARATSVTNYLRGIGFQPKIVKSGKGVHPSLQASALSRRVSIFAVYKYGRPDGGSTGGGSTGGLFIAMWKYATSIPGTLDFPNTRNFARRNCAEHANKRTEGIFESFCLRCDWLCSCFKRDHVRTEYGKGSSSCGSSIYSAKRLHWQAQHLLTFSAVGFNQPTSASCFHICQLSH
jgi:hypothetical protein